MRTLLERFGKIEYFHFAQDRATGRGKGFAFCTYSSVEFAWLAVDAQDLMMDVSWVGVRARASSSRFAMRGIGVCVCVCRLHAQAATAAAASRVAQAH